MRARGIAWGLCGLLASVWCNASACTDDGKADDRPDLPPGEMGNPRPIDAGRVDAGRVDAGPLDAGVALEELGLEGDRLVSDLSADETQQFCRKLDDVTSLLEDLEQACTVEAYLLTFDANRCDAIVEQCVGNGATMLGLELELPCSGEPLVIEDCAAPLGDVLACAVQLGDFWASRECQTASLADLGPLCPRALAADCPALFASE
ncbi:MAG TPA: hypothetical protein VK509_12600 [Polyangiales bacterium]|nr:hypothetical protein [Polyangiales bacterium]